MNPTPDSGEHGEFSDSDQQWFDRLSGKTAAASDARALQEADALRRALALERDAAAADPRIATMNDEARREHRWQQLQFRLRREGVQIERPASRRRWLPASFAAAAAVAFAAILLPPLFEDKRIYYDEPPALRGEQTLVRRQDAHPKPAAETLAAALRAGGLTPSLHQSRKTFSVDVDVAADAPATSLEALRKAGLPAGTGLLRVEIVPKP